MNSNRDSMYIGSREVLGLRKTLGENSEEEDNPILGVDLSGRKYIQIDDNRIFAIPRSTDCKSEASSSKDILKFVKQSGDNAKVIKNLLKNGAVIKHKFALVEEGRFKCLKKIINKALSTFGITNKGKIEKAIEKTIALDRLNQLLEDLSIEPHELQDIKKMTSYVSLNRVLKDSLDLNVKDFSTQDGEIEAFKKEVFEKLTQEDAKEFIKLVKKYGGTEEQKDIKDVLFFLLKDQNKSSFKADDNYRTCSVALDPPYNEEDPPFSYTWDR